MAAKRKLQSLETRSLELLMNYKFSFDELYAFYACYICVLKVFIDIKQLERNKITKYNSKEKFINNDISRESA